MTASRRLTVVTAADRRYGRCLTQLLRSAERRRLHRTHRWIVYDLGLSTPQRASVASRFPWLEMRLFDFAAHPPHFALACESWAWKPAIIHELIDETRGPVLWLDSATLLHADLAEVQATIDAEGVYVLAGQTAVGLHCDPLVLERLAPPLEILDRPEIVAGVIGLNGARAHIRDLAADWHALACDKLTIVPRAPRLKTHKPEQALLTLLLYQYLDRGLMRLPCGEIDISSVCPVRWMSSRNKVAWWVPEWADLPIRTYWRCFKMLDRAWLRCKAFEARHVSGWYRYVKEHYSVSMALSRGTEVRSVRAPKGTYLADPFLIARDSKLFLFVERFSYKNNVGRLLVMELDASMNAMHARELPLPPGHTSFPHVFLHEGRVYLVPETCNRRCVDLYVFDRFPDAPRLVRRLLYGLDAADTIVFERKGRFWLMTSVRRRESSTARHLEIYHFEGLERGRLTPHPHNQRRLYGDLPYSWGRCAGPVIECAGQLLRPIHTSQKYYGERIGWMRIEKLTVDSFSEVPASIPAELAITASRDLHHVSSAGDAVAWDCRDRAGYLQGLRSLLVSSSRMVAQ